MATSCPIGFNEKRLRDEVAKLYAEVVTNPTGDFHFHRGPRFAADLLGYDPVELVALPEETTAAFAGVANPFLIAPIVAGETVVDVGSGSGTDLLLAARKVGATGRVIGVDMTEVMRVRARASAAQLGLTQVEVREGDAQALPVDSATADVVISNGVINLTTDKVEALSEIYRVLRPGGRLQLADIVVGSELPEGVRNNIDLWAAWIGGALPEAELVSTLSELGFVDVAVVARFDCFRGTSKESVATTFGVRGVNVLARKPAP